jgi:hypothetical protein
MHARRVAMIASLLVVSASACSASGSDLPAVPSTIVSTGTTPDETVVTTTSVPGAAAEVDETTTVTSGSLRLVAPPVDEPAYEDVDIGTEDGLTLHGRVWEGGDVAVLYTHEYSHAYADKEPVNSLGLETLVPSTWALADAGFTVLAIDFRGHGTSEGTYSVLDSPLDMQAAYRFLTDRGFTTIVGMASGNSAPVMANVAANDPSFELAGLGMLFTPLGETGFDAASALEEIDEPVWLVGIDVGSFGGVVKRLQPHVVNLYDGIIFPRVPTGLEFADVYGEEYLGRQLDFIETVTAG